MRKTYQNEEIDTSAPTVAEAVSVALAELVGEVQEGLLALAVGTGLQVLTALMEKDVTAQCGVKGRHDPTRCATRHGHGAGSVTLGGRRVPVARPRMRASDGCGELPVPAYELFSRTEVLGRMAMERMLAGLSTRRYPVGLEPVGTRVEHSARATSKSAVSRRFVTATETALAELLSADLSGLDLVALMVDGVRFAEHCCVVALGIDIDGVKHPLSLVEGSTENATLVSDLLVGLVELIHPQPLWLQTIHEHNASRIQARLITEAANAAVTPEADALLNEKGIFVLPDILANSGGVVVSYFEWVQDLQAFFWEEEEINTKLHHVITRAFYEVLHYSVNKRIHMRTAAYALAVKRVADANEVRGIYP